MINIDQKINMTQDVNNWHEGISIGGRNPSIPTWIRIQWFWAEKHRVTIINEK